MSAPQTASAPVTDVLPSMVHADAHRHSTEPEAAARLNSSREQLRRALSQAANPPRRPSLMAGTWVGSLAQSLMARLRSFPAAALALDSVQAWWRKQAVRTAAVVAVTGVNAMIKPTARRKPELLLLSAFAVGAGLAWIRPWRILKRPSLLSTAIAQIASEAKR